LIDEDRVKLTSLLNLLDCPYSGSI